MDTGLIVGLAPVPWLVFRFVRGILKRRRSAEIDPSTPDKQPDTIRLRRRTFDWRNPAAVQSATGPLLARSFSEVGDFSIAEIPELKVRLLVNPARSIYGCIYERPGRRVWLDLVSRYQDGSIAIFSTALDPGTECRPEDMMVDAPELSADMLYTRMLQERPQRPLVKVDAKALPTIVANTHRDLTEWRKRERVPATDVAQPTASSNAPAVATKVV